MSSIREARALFERAEQWSKEGLSLALVTLVQVKGSAYRRPGAKMVMASNGRMQGTLSGGCLEGDLFVHAEQVMATLEPSLHHYDLTEDDMWGLGIGCKGSVDIWVEPLDLAKPFWHQFHQRIEAEEPTLWGATLPNGGRFYAAKGQGPVTMGESLDFNGFDVPEILGGTEDTGRYQNIWWDVMRPPERLIIAGAGHDAEPLARLAHQAGFDVIMLDPREHVNNQERFADAQHWVASSADVKPETVDKAFWVLMNHHQRRDEEAFLLASQSHPKFVGVLGPKSRTDEMMVNMGIKRENLPLRSPVGLYIGAENPLEVAVSIVSELMAVRRGTPGGSLHGKERIHR